MLTVQKRREVKEEIGMPALCECSVSRNNPSVSHTSSRDGRLKSEMQTKDYGRTVGADNAFWFSQFSAGWS